MSEYSDLVSGPDNVDKTSRGVREMFGSIAVRYDFLNHLLSANQDKRWRRRAVLLLTPRAGETILDLCCGTGDLALEINKRQPRCKVVGADFAIPMLRLAQEKSSTQNIEWMAADALNLPFPDATFDAVTVGFGVRNFENTRRGMEEIHRVLKPGGRVLVLEFMRPQVPKILEKAFSLWSRVVLPCIGKLLSKHNSAYSYLPASVHGFLTRDEFKSLLRDISFTNVRSFNYSGGISTATIGMKK